MPPLKTSNPLPLDAVDLANLRASGLTDKTIRENGLRTNNEALEFTYRDLNGDTNCFVRRRPHKPRTIDGKAVKYEQPKGSPLRAYFPVASLTGLRDEATDLFIVEGEKKALALSQLGLAAAGIGGVYCGLKKQSVELIDDLAALQLRGRNVYIVFDYDVKPETRRHVDAARLKLANALRKQGAKEVYAINLPPGPNGEKQGVDDFVVANGANAFRTLVKEAEPVPDFTLLPLHKPSGRTDAANAARLIEAFGNEIRWVGPWDKFLIWDGKRWRIDQELKIEAFGKRVAKGLWRELADDIQNLNLSGDIVSAMCGFVRTSNNANGIRAMVSLARSEPGVAIGVDQLDSDPWLLNVQNGTVDLRTGGVREFRREDYITKLAPVKFDPAAVCPNWMQFLTKIFAGDEILIDYMRRLVGYSLTGVTEEHILPFLYGIGANGKSTFCELVLKYLGPDYAMKAPPDLLMAKRGESHPTERADLYGKRFVACIETEAGRRMAEALVKELTGGDRVRARRMREDFWEFVPTHHVWLSSNYKPVVRGTDHGIWRRIKLIPFDVVIPDDQQDKKLPGKLEAELSGILNWAIAGCLDWQINGMQEPTAVSGATTNYRDEMDDIGQFLDEFCELGTDFVVPATRLYETFIEVTGSQLGQKNFGLELGRRGFDRVRVTRGPSKGKHGWRGLRLIGDDKLDEQVKRIAEGFKRKKQQETK